MFVLSLAFVCLVIPLSVMASRNCPIFPEVVSPSQLEELQASRLGVALELLHSVASEDPSQNVFLSPESIYTAFQLLYFGSSGRSEEILRTFLHIPDGMTKKTIFGTYVWERQYYRNRKYDVDSANRIYFQRGLKVRSCVLDFFSVAGEFDVVDFQHKLNTSVNKINKWVEKKTKNMIKNLLPEGYLDSHTVMVLVNAIYFRGLWKTQFLEQNTHQAKFHLADGSTKSVQMMNILGNKFRHMHSKDFGLQAIELPYEGDDVSMIIIMPRRSNPSAIKNLLSSLTLGRLEKILSQILASPLKEGDVAIPKFKIEKNFDLSLIMEKLGAGELFRSVDLSDILVESEMLKVKALHAAKIEVDEKGAKAAAATAVVAVNRNIGSVLFQANKPFLYFIYNRDTNSLLFTGVFNSP